MIAAAAPAAMVEIAPVRRTAAGFVIVPRAHGMAEMFDPAGARCGIFSNTALAAQTLAQLAYILP